MLKEAHARTGRIPKVIMTDHLKAYIHGITFTFGDQAKHWQVKKFASKPNNNIIECMQGIQVNKQCKNASGNILLLNKKQVKKIVKQEIVKYMRKLISQRIAFRVKMDELFKDS